MSAATIVRLKIALDDVKPAVLRRIEVPLAIRLDRLHLAIQAAMGWTNSHLYEIRAGDVGTKTMRYLYDFGDGWEHTIRVERLIDPEPGVIYPRLIEASGRCPPEDVGGPWGYAEFLEAMYDSNHERHAEFAEWIGEDFDPNAVDADRLAKDVGTLAKSWTRKPASKRARRR